MNWEDYKSAVVSDARDVIKDEHENYEDWQELYDDLFIDDSVTGNGSGSYTFSTARAAENVKGIIFDSEAIEAFRDMGYEGVPTERGPEACDVIARCCALGYVSGELESYFAEMKAGEEWCCSECSDQYEVPQKLVILEYGDGEFSCPECGCTTSCPSEDGCFKPSDN